MYTIMCVYGAMYAKTKNNNKYNKDSETIPQACSKHPGYILMMCNRGDISIYRNVEFYIVM